MQISSLLRDEEIKELQQKFYEYFKTGYALKAKIRVPAKWSGNWSLYIARNLLLRYSTKGDLVLDWFAGGGTIFVEAKLLNRNIIDVNDIAIDQGKENLHFPLK